MIAVYIPSDIFNVLNYHRTSTFVIYLPTIVCVCVCVCVCLCVVCEWVIDCITAAHPEDPNLLLGAGSNNATLTVFDLRSAEPVKQWNVCTHRLALALPGCQTYFSSWCLIISCVSCVCRVRVYSRTEAR
jgi:hypothetical protein